MLRQRAIGASSEGHDHACQVLGLDLLNRPPAAAAGQLGLDQGQRADAGCARRRGRLVGVSFGDDRNPSSAPSIATSASRTRADSTATRTVVSGRSPLAARSSLCLSAPLAGFTVEF